MKEKAKNKKELTATPDKLKKSGEGKKLEEQLRASEEKFRAILEAVPDLMLIMDSEGRYRDIFTDNLNLLAFPASQLLGKTVHEMMPENIAQLHQSVINQTLLTGKPQHIEYPLEIHGVDHWFFANVVKFIFQDSECVLWSARDITDGKKSEEAIKESEARYRGLSEATFSSIFISEKGVCLEQNSTAEKMFGYTLSEAIGRRGIEWISPDDREMVEKKMLSGYEEPYEATALRKNGSTFPTEIQGKKIHYKGRSVRVTALSDITKRKAAETALRESQERLELAVTGTNLGLWDNNLLTGENTLNRQYAEMLGYEPGEIRNNFESFKEFIHPDDLPEMMKKLQRHMDGETSSYKAEFRMRAKNGEWKWIQSSGIVSERDENGKPLRIIGTQRNITENKQTEKAIERAKNEWELTFDTIPDMIMILDKQYRIIRANRATADKLGIPITELPGKICYQVLHGTEAPPNSCPHAELLKDSREHTVEMHMDLLGGNYMITATPFFDMEGHSIGSVHVARDISSLKAAEVAQRKSEERMELAIAGANLGLWDQNIVTGKSIHNRHWAEMLGYTPEEIETEHISWDNLLYPEDFLPALKDLNEHLAGKTPFYESEFRLRTKSGDWKWIQSSGRVSERDDDGKPLRMLGTHRDITDRKEMEQALQENKDRLEMAVTVTNLGMWDWNILTGKSIYSREWTQMLGYTPEEIKPHSDSWKNLIHPKDSERTMALLKEHFEGKTPLFEAVLRLASKTGEWKWIQTVGRVYERDNAGKPLRMIGTHRDITEQKLSTEELGNYREHLEELVKERTTELQSLVGAMAGREARMADLKDVVKLLREQIEETGMEPVADDPLLGGK